MSGIYIPGMEMPKNCFDCPLFDDVYTDADGDDDYSCGLGVPLDYYQASGETNKGCPLVPVPPHGLIAREQILDAIRLELAQADACNDTEDYDSWMRVFDYVRKFPTFIPADKPKEEPS